MRVAVVVVTYNAIDRIEACLISLNKQTYPHDHYDVVVIDNASGDGTVALIQEKFPNVVVYANEKNVGFAGGNNMGMHWAYMHGYHAVVLLNDDTRVRDTWLYELVNTAQTDDRIGIVQSKVLFAQEAYRVNTIGNPLHPLGFSWSGGYKDLSSQHQVDTDIMIASGCSMLIKRSVIERIGYLDDKLFLYHEDVDYSWRAHMAGYRLRLAAGSVVFHDYSFGIGGKKYYFAERNRLIVFFSHYRFLTIILLLPALILTEVVLLGYAFLTDWGKWKIKSYGGFILLIPHIIKKRMLNREYRVRSDRYMIREMSPLLQFEAVDTIMLKFIYNPVFFVYWRLVRLFII